MIGPDIDQFDAQLQEPKAQTRPMSSGGIAPWRAVVDKDRIGQTVAAEGRL